MAYETLLYEVADEIATITLNRPAKMNAYTGEMGREIAEAMLQADRDRSARVVPGLAGLVDDLRQHPSRRPL